MNGIKIFSFCRLGLVMSTTFFHISLCAYGLEVRNLSAHSWEYNRAYRMKGFILLNCVFYLMLGRRSPSQTMIS